MAETPNLSLPYIEAAQAQKHVTHNEALRALDAVVQLMVLDKDLATPPGAPAEGDRYIVAAAPAGAWLGKAASIAAWQDGAWAFYAPREGCSAWVADENKIYVWSGAAWLVLSGSAIDLQNVPMVGINGTADATNKLVVASPAALFTHAGDDVQIKVNKNAAGDSASFLFQTGFSGRAEIGTTGEDALHVKVSADGSTFLDALTIDNASGVLSVPQGRIDRSGPATVLASHDPSALDADAAPFRWTVQDFAGVNLPGSARANVAWRFGYNIAPGGERLDSAEPALADEWEIFFTQGGVQVVERHIAFVDTAGNLRRPLSFLIPRDGGAGSVADIAVDVLNFKKLDGTQKAKLDNVNGVLDLLGGTTLRGWTNNDPVQQQRNASDTGFINLPYINASNYCQFEAPVFVSGQIGSLGALLFMTTGNASNSNKLLDLYFSNTVTGTVASKIEGAASSGHELICYNTHTSSGNAHASLLARTLPGGGDANVVFDAIGGASWAIGVDRSDGAKFKVSRHLGLGTNDSLVIDANVVEAKLPAKLASYIVAGVPSASTVGAGALIFVSNESGGAVPAFSDGTSWRRMTDRAVVS